MLNFAILSAGNIAGRMARTLDSLRDEVQPYAIAARDSARAQALAGRYGFAKSFAGYEALLADPAVDVVYIGSIHPLHAQHIRAALLAGKHVLCEKPIVTAPEQFEELRAFAAEKGLVYMEAIMMCHLPARETLHRTVAQIGRVSAARFDFSQLSSRYPALLRGEVPNIFNPAMAAGSLMDLGVYCVYPAIDLFGEPERVRLMGDIDTFTRMVWNSLNEDNKVSLFVRYIDLATGKTQDRIVNKYEKV